MKEPKIKEALRIAYDNTWDRVWVKGNKYIYIIYVLKDDTKPKIVIL
jgi:hypothetical protein